MYNEVMVSVDAVNIDYEYKAFMNVVICTEWTFFFCLTFCSGLKYGNIAWTKAMCLCHNQLKRKPWEMSGYRYRKSKNVMSEA